MPQRIAVTLASLVGAAFAALLQTAGPAAAADVSTVALFASPARYVLCPAAAAGRRDCQPGGNPTDAAAVTRLRAGADAPGIERVVLFLPGYRTKLADGRKAAFRIAQVLGPRFYVIHVDWGSHGTAAGYHEDGVAARRAAATFADLVTALHAAMPERELCVFGHSMGTRVAAGAMSLVKATIGRNPFVAETVFAAPDLNLANYERAILRDPLPFGRVTIYVSRHDKALLMSSVIHFHRRIGQFSVWHKELADTSVVDASAADPGAEGHGYAIHDDPVIRDIGAVFLDSAIPHPAWTRRSGGSVMWTLVPANVPNLTEVVAGTYASRQ